jgi:hypothetical protein
MDFLNIVTVTPADSIATSPVRYLKKDMYSIVFWYRLRLETKKKPSKSEIGEVSRREQQSKRTKHLTEKKNKDIEDKKVNKRVL